MQAIQDVCPHCIVVNSRKKPTAGIQPIITEGMCVHGQTDIIDLQSMPDGNFKFLLNYNDLRNRAAANMTKTAYSIRSKLLMKSPQLLIKKGDVVLVPLDDVDRTKVDDSFNIKSLQSQSIKPEGA